jgi:hypothetical protein
MAGGLRLLACALGRGAGTRESLKTEHGQAGTLGKSKGGALKVVATWVHCFAV